MFRQITTFLLATAYFSTTSASLLERFEDWVKEHNIIHKDGVHREQIFNTWTTNDKYIDDMNSRNLTYTLGHNQFSGMSSDEFNNFMGFQFNLEKIDPSKIESKIHHVKTKLHEIKCLKDCVDNYDTSNKLDTVTCVTSCIQDAKDELSLTNVPESIDWVNNGAVTPVKNQGQCGSCWSFSTTGALEGAYYIKNGVLDSFSEQQLVDCDTRKNGGKDMGCNGGLMDNAFSWIEKNGGLCTEEDYAYTSGTTKTAGTCDTSCTVVSGSEIISYTDVKANSDNDMMSALAQQPVSIAIQADQKDFQLYNSGVFTGSCGTKLDHGVLVVGYGSLDGEDYYRVKNSWGTTWGDNGYIYLGRGDKFNNGSGQCGMLMQASYPTV